MRTTRKLCVLTCVVGAIFAVPVSNALASSNNEGRGGNSMVCSGVKSHAALVALSMGAPDMCGHADVARIWRHFGITPQAARSMHRMTVCSNGGWMSSGRQHSPNPSADVLQSGGFFTRPLSVWGSVCYDAWGTTLEDGTQVAVLVGCGNPEMRKGHRPSLKPKPVPKKIIPRPAIKPKPKPDVCVNIKGVQVIAPKGTTRVIVNGRLVCIKKAVPTIPAAKPVCLLGGTPLFSPLPAGVTNVSGVCTVQSNTATTTQNPTTTTGTSGNQSPATSTVTPISVTVQNNVTGTNTNQQGQTQTTSTTPCSCTTTTTQTPPPAIPPTVTNLTQLQGQGGTLAGNTYQVCVDVSGQSGHTISVSFGAQFGSFSGGPFSTSTGTGHFCASYTAPGEAVTDTYTATATDTSTSASGKASTTVTVQLQPNRA